MITTDLAVKLYSLYPDMVISNRAESVSIHPVKNSWPQVNIRFYEDRIEWQGYWCELRWSSPIGHAIGMPNLNYVLPSHCGKACEAVKLPLALDVEDRVLILTQEWFEKHPPGVLLVAPPVPDGYRLATEEEIEATRRAR